jgi:hypothetical protein
MTTQGEVAELGEHEARSTAAAAPLDTLGVASFTGGRTVRSPRFRLRQYVPLLREHGIPADEFVAQFEIWPPSNRALQWLWQPATIAQPVPAVVRSDKYDVRFRQREMVAPLLTLNTSFLHSIAQPASRQRERVIASGSSGESS